VKVLIIARPTLYNVPGGDTVQILETANALRQLDVNVDVRLSDELVDYNLYDLIHFFNIIRPHNIRPHLERSNLPFVVSTIYVDYSEIEKKHSSFFIRILYRFFGSNGLSYLKTIARYLVNGEKIIDRLYFVKGHKKSVEDILQRAHCLLPNSENEYKRLKKTYRFNTDYSVIPNAVSDDFIFEEFDFKREREGVLCIARIELLKNQLNLIKAVKDSNITLKISGKPAPNHIK